MLYYVLDNYIPVSPSSPLITEMVITYGIGNYSVMIVWQSLSGDEEMDSDWYILTLSQDDSIRENVTTQNSTRLFLI